MDTKGEFRIINENIKNISITCGQARDLSVNVWCLSIGGGMKWSKRFFTQPRLTLNNGFIVRNMFNFSAYNIIITNYSIQLYLLTL